MPTIAELVATAPHAASGYEIQLTRQGDPIRWVVELADPSAGAEVEWFDITGFYAGDATERGAATYQGRYNATVSRVTLEASFDQLAPTNEDTSGLFGVHVDLGAGLLVRAGLIRVDGSEVVEWWPIFTGRVESWGVASRANAQTQVHEVVVLDTMSSLVDQPVEETSEEPWQDRVAAILLDADWLFGHDIYGSFTVGGVDVLEVPARDEADSAISELDVVCDPAGIVWRSRRDGRLVFHPAPYDTFHSGFADDSGFDGDEWANPLLDDYPDGLVFSYLPDLTDVGYLVDVNVEPFGIEDTIVAVVNDVRATYPAGSYAVDDATSISRYGRRVQRVNWIVPNDVAVDQILDRRAFATKQARPLVTTIDDLGFFPAMALIDHLDPATVIHATHGTGTVVTATTRVRSIREERTMRHQAALSWTSTVTLDVDAVSEQDPLLPVEDLAFTDVGETTLAVSWTNPTQPSVEPTEVQFRVPELSLIWLETDYPATTLAWAGLTADTQYTVEVRLVRKVNGIVTNASTVERVVATTDPATVPNNPGPDPAGDDPGDTTVEIPDPDPDCDLEWELQENDGTGWVTVLSGDRDDLVDNGDGTWDLNIDESEFDPDKLYRVRSREVCGGIEGEWLNSQPWDPPDDWTDPCTTPPALAEPPYDDPDLVLFVPKICAPDIITEAISGLAGVRGPGFGNLLAQFDDDNDIALQANATGGIIAYGESTISGLTGSKTLAVTVNVATAANSILFEAAAIRISAGPIGSGWRPAVSVYTPAGTFAVVGDELDLDTTYVVAATWDADTGTAELFVAGVSVNSVTDAEPRPTINALPIWIVGAPADSWITKAAVWSKVLEISPASELPVTSGLWGWWDASDAATITDAGSGKVSQWDDKSGNGRHVTQASPGNRPTTGIRTINGLNAIDFVRANNQALTRSGLGSSVLVNGGEWTAYFVYVLDASASAHQQGRTLLGIYNAAGFSGRGLGFQATRNVSGIGNAFATFVGAGGDGGFASNVYDYSIWGHGIASELYVTEARIDVASYPQLPGWQRHKNGSVATLDSPTGANGDGTMTINSTNVWANTTTNATLSIGTQWDGALTAAAAFDGAVAAIILFNRLLDSTERTAMRDYLIDRYGLV
jgi:hypothetical protein